MSASTKIADVAQKTVTTGLVLLTVAGLADVTRGFNVLVQRNLERRRVAEADASARAVSASDAAAHSASSTESDASH
ncbi:hypothetical protein P43SY_009528 [Pythium insidiosum]|uniref:Uncharacterized protein n=1 Tax=Pythium insidiosum TaxID=114742 RepID=A0AAD5Q8C3_PYTIN|nr:hypothetical protein P43SY_009528 [Pythium insidiosum]